MNQHGEGKEGVEITQEAQRSDRRRSIREIECTYLSSLLHALQSRPPPRLISRLISRAPKAHHPPAPAAAAAAAASASAFVRGGGGAVVQLEQRGGGHGLQLGRVGREQVVRVPQVGLLPLPPPPPLPSPACLRPRRRRRRRAAAVASPHRWLGRRLLTGPAWACSSRCGALRLLLLFLLSRRRLQVRGGGEEAGLQDSDPGHRQDLRGTKEMKCRCTGQG